MGQNRDLQSSITQTKRECNRDYKLFIPENSSNSCIKIIDAAYRFQGRRWQTWRNKVPVSVQFARYRAYCEALLLTRDIHVAYFKN